MAYERTIAPPSILPHCGNQSPKPANRFLFGFANRNTKGRLLYLPKLLFVVIFSTRIHTLAGIIMLFALANGLNAQTTRVWNGGGANDNWTNPANWGGTAPVAGDDLVFAGILRLTPNNNFSSGTSFRHITFNNTAGAFIIGGNPINLTGDITNNDSDLQTINLNQIISATRNFNTAAGNIKVGGVISGNGGINKIGQFTLTLSGANTYVGITSINSGTLKLGKSSNVNTSGPLGSTTGNSVVLSGASLDLNGFSLTSTATEAISLNGTGAGGLGALTNSAVTASTYIGVITFVTDASACGEAGMISITGTPAAGNTGITLGGAVGGSVLTTIAESTAGQRTVIKTGAGTWTLSGVNTYTGNTTINAGILQIGAANRIADASNFVMNGGTFRTGSTAGYDETVGTLLLSENSIIALGTGSHSLRFAASDGLAWTPGKNLTITGRTSVCNSDNQGRIYVGITSTGLTSSQLAQIRFSIGSLLYPAAILSTGEVVPVDNTSPVITCPYTGNQNRNTNAGVCTYTPAGTEFDATATDNCAVTALTYTLIGATTGTGTSLNGVAFNPGITTVTWSAIDAAGNEATCSFTVTVIDNQNPVITCPYNGNTNRNTDTDVCIYTSIGNEFNAIATDNCAVTSLTYTLTGATIGAGSSLTGVILNIGITTVTWTATDSAGKTSSCSFTVTVIDAISPEITCPYTGNTDRNIDPGVCTYTALGNEFNATATDNCSLASLIYNLYGATTGTGVDLSGVAFNTGITAVVWTAKDGGGKTATCNFTVTVHDNQLPNLSCPPDQTGTTGPGVCLASLNVPYPAYSDNCSVAKLTWTMTGATVASSPNLPGIHLIPVPFIFNGGVTTVTYRAEDPSGNFVTCVFTVTVSDNQPPQFLDCPDDISVNAPADQCSAVAYFATPSAIDNCIGVTVVQTAGPPSGSIFPPGATPIVFTASDAATPPNTTICTFEVIIEDVTPPVITFCPYDTVIVINNSCAVVIPYGTLGLPEATDLCSPPVTWTNDYPPGGIFVVGNTIVTYTATDAAGNTSTCIQIVTLTRGIVIVDYNYKRYIPPWPITVTGTLLPDNTAPGVTSWQSFSPVALGNGRTKIVNDGIAPGPAAFLQHGDIKPCLFTNAQIPGNENPSYYYQFDMQGMGTSYISYYLYFQFKRENASNPKNLYVAWSVDGINYDTSLTIPVTNANYPPHTWGEVYQSLVGITEINNSPSISFRIYFDNQGNPLASFDNFQYIALNEEILVAEAIATNVECPSDTDGSIEIINTSPGSWQYTINGGQTWQEDPYFPNLGIGTYDVRMRMLIMLECDIVINVALPITSNDTIPPEITFCPPDTVVATTNPPENTWASINLPHPEFQDSCTTEANMVVEWILTGATVDTGTGFIPDNYIFFLGLTFVTYTITDEAGNSAECSFTVLVLTSPIITCPPDIIGETWTGVCWAELYPGYPSLNEGSGIITLTWIMTGATIDNGTGPIGAYIFNAGETFIEWTATNGVGSDSCTQKITVVDNQDPVITCPEGAPFVVNVNAGVTYLHIGTGWDAAATDNCTLVFVTAMLNGATISGPHTTLDSIIFNPGITTVTWTAIDECGNAAVCSFDVVVLGTADIETEKTGPASITAGQDISWTIIVLNNGPAIAPLVTLTDFIPPQVLAPVTYLLNGVPMGIWPDSIKFINMAVGLPGIKTIIITGQVACDATDFSNTATAVLSQPYTDPDLTNNAGTWITSIENALTIEGTVTNTTCPGYSDGTIDITVTGGTWPYSFFWTTIDGIIPAGQETNEDLTSLVAGTYTVIVTDFNGCNLTESFDVGSNMDSQPPSFTLSETELTYCANDIITAVFNPNPTPGITPEYDDITYPRPEYYLFTGGSTIFDLDSAINNFDDNCCTDNELTIHWLIVFSPTPNPATELHEPITEPAIPLQTGQPSLYGDIEFPGDGVYFTNTSHYLYYWLEDCNGNLSEEQVLMITVIPRPNVIKQ